MKTALLVINRPFGSDFDSLYGQTVHLVGKYDKIYFLNPYKTNRVLSKIVPEVESIDICEFLSRVHKMTYQTWEDVYNEFDLDLPAIDDVWIFGGPMSEGGKLKRKFGDTVGKYLTKNGFMNFISVSNLYSMLYMTLKLVNKYDSQIHELCYDPAEFSFGCIKEPRVKPRKSPLVYHAYDIPSLGIKRLDTWKEYLDNYTPKTDLFEREVSDLVYGYSYMTLERKSVYDDIIKVVSEIDTETYKVKIFEKNKIHNIDTSLSRDDYINEIMNSRFTLVFPAYAKDVFSIYRFMESLYYDCLPLIHSSCESSLVDVQNSFGISMDYLIFTTGSDLNCLLEMSEESRRAMLAMYKEAFL